MSMASTPIFEPGTVLAFDLQGPMAHFRDMQTNSSCLTYPFPPPTAISGLVAGILGMDKGSYHEIFAPDKCFMALEPKVPMRKAIFTVNYQVTFETGVTQIPFEVMLPENGDEIIYRLFFSCDDATIMEKLRSMILDGKAIYPPCMGSAGFLATVVYFGEGEASKVPDGTEVEVSTVLRASGLELASWTSGIKLMPAFMRRGFGAGRKPGAAEKYFLATGNHPVVRAIGNLYDLAFKDLIVHSCRM